MEKPSDSLNKQNVYQKRLRLSLGQTYIKKAKIKNGEWRTTT